MWKKKKKAVGLYQWWRCTFAYTAGKWDPITLKNHIELRVMWSDRPKAVYLWLDHSGHTVLPNVNNLSLSHLESKLTSCNASVNERCLHICSQTALKRCELTVMPAALDAGWMVVILVLYQKLFILNDGHGKSNLRTTNSCECHGC